MGRKMRFNLSQQEIQEVNDREDAVFYPSMEGASGANNTQQYLTKKGMRETGMENESEGFGNVFMENVVRGGKDVASSMLNTLGATQTSANINASVERNLDYDEKDLKFDTLGGFLGTVGDWTAQSLGAATPDIVGAVSAGAITGGLGLTAVAGSGSFSFARMYGSNVRMMRKWRPDADLSEIRANAVMLSMGQAVIEQFGGLEAGLSNKLISKKGAKVVAGEIAEEATKKGLIGPIAKIVGSSKNRAVAVAKGAASEMMEESMQGGAEVISGMMFGEQEYSASDLLDALVIEPMRALPAGGLMGGVFHTANSKGKASASFPEVTQKVQENMFAIRGPDGKIYTDQKAIDEDNAAFSALTSTLQEHYGANAEGVSAKIKSLAYSLSLSAQTNYGEALLPKDFIKDLEIAFIDAELSSQDLSAISSISSSTDISSTMKGDEILKYINGRFGTESSIYQAIHGVQQNVEASEIAYDTEQIVKQYRKSVPDISDELRQEWNSDITEKVTATQGLNQDFTLLPKSGKPSNMTFNQAAETLTREDVARISIENPVVKINGVEYVMDADETGVTFEEATEYNSNKSAIYEELLEQVRNERKHANATGGDAALAREKLTHGIVEARGILPTTLESYDNRLGSTYAETRRARYENDIANQKADTAEAVVNARTIKEEVESKAAAKAEARRQQNDRVIKGVQDNTALDRNAADYKEKVAARDAAELAEKKSQNQRVIEKFKTKQSSKDASELMSNTDDLVESFNQMQQKIEAGEEVEPDAVVKEPTQLQREASPLLRQLTEAKGRTEAMYYVGELTKLYNAYDQKFDRHEALANDLMLSEQEAIDASNKPAMEMGEAALQLESKKIGVEFSSINQSSGSPIFFDNETGAYFSATGEQSVYEALEAHRGSWQEGSVQTLDSAFLTEQGPDSDQINGMYITGNRTALFFKGAGPQTVIHEFVHHAKSLLPIEMQNDILELFNDQKGRAEVSWTVEADEWFANTMTKWIADRQRPDATPEQMKTFRRIRSIVMSAYKNFDLSEETSLKLDEMFGALPDQALVVGAHEGLSAMIKIDPPTVDMMNKQLAGDDDGRFADKFEDIPAARSEDVGDAVRFDSNASSTSRASFSKGDRQKASNQLHAIMGGDHKAATKAANTAYGVNSISDLTDDQLSGLIKTLNVKNAKNDSEILIQAQNDGQRILDWTRKAFTKRQSERNLSSDSRSTKALSDMVNKIKDVGIRGMITTSSMQSMTKILDDFSDKGVWHDLVDAPIRTAREQGAVLVREYEERFASVIKKHNVDMGKVQRKTYELAGQDYKGGEVVYLSIISRMREQDINSFVESNYSEDIALGHRVLAEADQLARGDQELTGFIDATQEMYEEIWEPLSEVYEKVTGRPMGKLDWYLPFVRMNEWDDLDQTLAGLNSIDKRGNDHYRSATSAMKERKGDAGSRIDISDPFGATGRYIRQAAKYIATAETVKQVSTTLSTEEVKDSLKWKYGTGTMHGKASWSFVHTIMTELVRGEMYHDARIRPMSEMETHLKRWRTGFTMFAIAGNIASSLKQVLSAPLGVSRSGMPGRVALRASAEMFDILPKAFMNGMYNVGKFASGKATASEYNHILKGTRVYEDWQKYSNVLLNRHGNPETGEAMNYNFKGFMGIQISGIPLGEALMAGITSMDAVTVGVLWESTKDAWLRKNKETMSESDAMADAVDKANKMISDTQPPSLPQERSQLQRGNEYIRSTFMFTGATMRQYEVFVTDIAGRSFKALSRLKKDGIGSVYDLMFKGDDLQSGLIVQAGVGFLIPAVMFGIMSRRRKPTEKELMLDILSYPFAAMPLAKGLLGSAVGVETYDAGEISSYYGAVAKEVADGIEATARALHGEGWTGDNIKQTMDMLAMFTNSPRTMGRIVSAAFVGASGQNTMLGELKEQYIDPFDETKEF